MRTKITQTMKRGPGSTSHTDCALKLGAEKANRRARLKSESPHAVARLFISTTRENSPVYDAGAQAHGPYSLGVGSRVQKE
jgi:hypothetical protein